jgi:predicted enzyme related to lactoylglutathione lyase
VKVVTVLDCMDPIALAPFWAKALGYRQTEPAEPYLTLEPDLPDQPALMLQRVPEPKRGKNRMHLDLRVDRPEEERDRLMGLGASCLREEPVEEDGFRWYLMADPEGNEFCVVKAP